MLIRKNKTKTEKPQKMSIYRFTINDMDECRKKSSKNRRKFFQKLYLNRLNQQRETYKTKVRKATENFF